MPPYKIKLSIPPQRFGSIMLRQTSEAKGLSKCGKYRFYINEFVENPDFWVVMDKAIRSKESCSIAPENTVLLITEPKSVINYPRKYRDQFAMVCSCQEKLNHRNVVYTPAILPWFVGWQLKNGKPEYTLDYDFLERNPIPQKSKLISVITSNKAFTKGHHDRIAFVEKLKKHYGDKLDVFGQGFNDFEDKWNVLAPYKYHISIENSSSKYYWTEKISDCYLTGTFPLYFGCTNLNEYFPENSYKPIDIHRFDEAVNIIDQTIANNEFEKNQEVLESCKRLVMDDYNMFNLIAKYCDGLNAESPRHIKILKPAISLLDWHNFYLYLIGRNFWNSKFFIQSLFQKK
jgi:hypothetical protein